jgi:hypothetical protein
VNARISNSTEVLGRSGWFPGVIQVLYMVSIEDNKNLTFVPTQPAQTAQVECQFVI